MHRFPVGAQRTAFVPVFATMGEALQPGSTPHELGAGDSRATAEEGASTADAPALPACGISDRETSSVGWTAS